MLGRNWIPLTLAVVLPLTLGACGGDKDDGGGGDTGPGGGGGGGGGGGSVLEAFDDNDWYGTCTRGEVEFPCEANLDYDEATGEVTGTMDIDALWDVVIVENEDGSITGTGSPVFGDDVLELSNLAVDGDGTMTGEWSWDYGNGVYEGSIEMSDEGAG